MQNDYISVISIIKFLLKYYVNEEISLMIIFFKLKIQDRLSIIPIYFLYVFFSMKIILDFTYFIIKYIIIYYFINKKQSNLQVHAQQNHVQRDLRI